MWDLSPDLNPAAGGQTCQFVVFNQNVPTQQKFKSTENLYYCIVTFSYIKIELFPSHYSKYEYVG